MLSSILAHAGMPIAPHDLWAAWNLDLSIAVGLVIAGWAYRRGRQRISPDRRNRQRPTMFGLALTAVALALLSPLDAMAGALASAHMVQHLLLIMVAAPLFILGDPATILRGLPQGVRKVSGIWRRRLRLTPNRWRLMGHPVAIFLLHAGALWFWHARVPYEAALENDALHVLEHVSFLLTALLFWAAVLQTRRARRLSPGIAVLLIFTMAMQGVLLSALITFADSAWYPSYAATTAAWGLDSLSDQQLAGLIMWIPSGLIYTGAALSILASWIGQSEIREAL